MAARHIKDLRGPFCGLTCKRHTQVCRLGVGACLRSVNSPGTVFYPISKDRFVRCMGCTGGGMGGIDANMQTILAHALSRARACSSPPNPPSPVPFWLPFDSH